MIMNRIDSYAITYPLLNHPLSNERVDEKIKYVCLLERYRIKFCRNSKPAKERLRRFASDFINKGESYQIDVAESAKDILKTWFTPFRLFSFRYVFLFDCIYLFAILNKQLATKICAEFKSSVHHRYHRRINELFNMMFNEDASLIDEYLISQEQFDAWCRMRRYMRTSKKSIAFTATMSAGKSTLINALIGQELSYARKTACTATVMQFHSEPVYHPSYNIIADDETVVNISAEDVRSYTKEREKPCAVVGYFESAFNNNRVVFYDTPGVNSSQNPAHRAITRDELTKRPHDIIVYVIPVECYGSDDDYSHLKFICENADYNKIIFVVNMMDACDFEDDSISQIMSDVTAHLKDIGYAEPLVCPISAKAGLLFKRALAGNELSKNDIKALLALYAKFEDPEYDLSGCYNVQAYPAFHYLGYKLNEVPYDKLYQAYLHTGLPQLENILLKKIKEG